MKIIDSRRCFSGKEKLFRIYKRVEIRCYSSVRACRAADPVPAGEGVPRGVGGARMKDEL